MMESMGGGMKMPGLDAMQAQQEAFMKALTGGIGWPGSTPTPEASESADGEEGEDLDAIKKQLAELQEKLSKLK